MTRDRAKPDYLSAWLCRAPLFSALVRGVECRLLRTMGPLASPVLDVGCGDGLFASLALPGGVDFGIDADPSASRRARALRAHRCLVRADATSLPFPSGYFGAIVCNSVLEHIPDIERAVGECARTLRMGGRLFITAPSHRFGELLLGSAIARRIGLDRLARGYAGWFNRHSRHFHTDGCEVWSARLQRHGLAIRTVQIYMTSDALRAFDLAHYLSVPRLGCYRLTGRWTLSANPPLNRLFDAWLRPHYTAAFPTTDGPYICLEATK